MQTIFLNRRGDVLFTYPNVDLHTGDHVKFDGKIYLVVSKTFDVQGGFLEIILHESAETD